MNIAKIITVRNTKLIQEQDSDICMDLNNLLGEGDFFWGMGRKTKRKGEGKESTEKFS